jgi:hypothetical protein
MAFGSKVWKSFLWVAVLSCITFPVSGKVFRLFGGGEGNDSFLNGSLPWDYAYETQMTVSGRPATMRVYSARFSEPVVQQLKSRFEQLGATVEINPSEMGATGRAIFPDQTISFLILKPPQEPTQQIFIYEPTGEQQRAEKMPVPDFNRATIRSVITDDETGTYLATLDTSASSTEAHSFYGKALQAEGWKMVAPGLIKNGRISGMAVYEKNSKVCYVQAVDRVDGPNMITLLVKGGTL